MLLSCWDVFSVSAFCNKRSTVSTANYSIFINYKNLAPSAAILEDSNGDISAADHPIYSVFGSRMGFSGSADRMALFPVLPKSIVMWERQCARSN